jgi:hypothetical protein
MTHIWVCLIGAVAVVSAMAQTAREIFGEGALSVSPRVGHLHITVDDAPWHWVDASGEPLVLQGLPTGSHKVLIELADPTHRVIDRGVVSLVIPNKNR